MITTQNPATEDILSTYNFYSKEQILTRLTQAKSAQQKWAELQLTDRSDILKSTAQILRSTKRSCAELITEEMGKPILAAAAEIEKCAYVCEHYADFALDYLSPKSINLSNTSKAEITFDPLGVILAIMPWNFPFWQVFRFAAPNLMAGNAILLKHAPNTTGCGLMIEDIFKKSGLPHPVFSTVLTDTKDIETIIASPHISGVTLTGSKKAGASVAELSGRHLKKCVLELGGSDPYIVLNDADLKNAVDSCSHSRFLNSGQTCVAAKRWIVEDSIYDEFRTFVIQNLSALAHGDPTKPETQLGPLARKDLVENLERQVQESVKLGAKIIYREKITSKSGFYFPVTLLENVTKDMPVFYEELFGPVAVLLRAASEQDAITIANNCEYGLGAAVFSKNIQRAKNIVNQLQVGVCAINDFVRSDPRIPFGGIKHSGFGRELGEYGILEFTNIKTVCTQI